MGISRTSSLILLGSIMLLCFHHPGEGMPVLRGNGPARRSTGLMGVQTVAKVAHSIDDKGHEVQGTPDPSPPLPLLNNVFQSNMVLQRGTPVQIWGNATAGEWVTVTTGAVKAIAITSTFGEWRTTLPAWNDTTKPYTVTATGSLSKRTQTLTNVMYGDVYICGGQSNMAFTLPSAFDAATLTASAQNYPNIRIMQVATTMSQQPRFSIAKFRVPWSPSSTQAVSGKPGRPWTYFSAVCWITGKTIYDERRLAGDTTPIGLISSEQGGTSVTQWSSPRALAKCPQPNPPNPRKPASTLYNAMIAPLGPMTISGILWYQGENNVLYGGPAFYQCALPAMIKDWRLQFDKRTRNGRPPAFLFVQLSPYFPGSGNNTALPLMRLAQDYIARHVDQAALATAFDGGDIASPYAPVHSRNKTIVGQRLAYLAEAVVYGRLDSPSVPPQVHNITVDSSGNLVIRFDNVYGPMVVLNGDPTTQCPSGHFMSNASAMGDCAGFEAYSSNVWYPCPTVALGASNDTVILKCSAPPVSSSSSSSSSSAAAPPTYTQVRYGFANWPIATVYNTVQGQPALPLYPFISKVTSKPVSTRGKHQRSRMSSAILK